MENRTLSQLIYDAIITVVTNTDMDITRKEMHDPKSLMI